VLSFCFLAECVPYNNIDVSPSCLLQHDLFPTPDAVNKPFRDGTLCFFYLGSSCAASFRGGPHWFCLLRAERNSSYCFYSPLRGQRARLTRMKTKG
jgi:hypothetical protein